MIHVRLTQDSDPLELAAVICVGDGETRHQVTMARGDYERL